MEKTEKVDENLYSRQIAVYGAETMGKLIKFRVFLYGLQGVGIETAKNLILAGPAAVTLQDDTLVQIKDLGSNFYATENDVGKVSRADAAEKQLRELNNYVKVSVHKGDVTKEFLANFDIVVFSDYYNKAKLIEFNNFCRSKNIGFIYTGNLGLYGFCFVDFGDNFKVLDHNGEDSRNIIINGITQEEQGVVTLHEEKRHGFEDGETVTFREVEGMSEVNGKLFKVLVKSPQTFSINADTRQFQPYLRNGICEQVKMPLDLSFKSLELSLELPIAPGKNELDLCDWEKIGRPQQLHVILNAVLNFVTQEGQLPGLHNLEDAQKIKQLAEAINENNKKLKREGENILDSIDQELVFNVSQYARCNITCVAAFWGGIVAQEIVKFTGKYTPIRQWLHHEMFESLPDENAEKKIDRTIKNSRYDDLIAIYGNELQQQLAKQKVFMIGAGALGCEYIKQFGLLGLCQNQGNLLVTDNDNIEISNLNRQFLFRKHNVGFSKAECAISAVQKMNKNLNAKACKMLVCPETEDFFDDNFWEGLDLVVNAVDNVKARLFVDGKCVLYQKPLFESGTLGTKCNSQIILPKLTQSYGESQDPPEESIPLCTLKNFPNQIEHCIQWARDYFEGIFVEGPNECIKYLKDPVRYLAETQNSLEKQSAVLRGRLETVKRMAKAYAGGKYENLVELARNLFQEIFYNQIADLLGCFPKDHKMENGQLFWSGPKRPPTPIEFNPKDETHLEFIQSAANIFAFIFGVPQCKDTNTILQLASKAPFEPYKPKKIKVKADDKDTTEEKAEGDEEVIATLIAELKSQQIKLNSQLNNIEFEKDDPTNWHIELVSSISNLRARNYQLKEITKFKVKLIAGKIIPALATTTAMVVGAVGVEIIKRCLNKDVSKMKNSFMNLALPLWLFSEPIPPQKAKDIKYDVIVMGPVKAIPPGFTTWDRIELIGPHTIQNLIDYLKKTYNVNLTFVSFAKFLLFNGYSDLNNKEKLNKDLQLIVQEISQKPITKGKKFLELVVSGNIETPDGEADVNMPLIKYYFHGKN